MATLAKYEVRDFMLDARTKILSAFEIKPLARILLCMPTATGKTITIGDVLVDDLIVDQLLQGKNRSSLRVVFKSHRDRLLVQAERTFAGHANFSVVENFSHWLHNEKSKSRIEVMYCMLGDKLPEGIEIDLIVIDECHHEACNTYQYFLEEGGKYPCIGLTATPDRPDGLLVKFDFFIEPITRREAVARGLICETDIKSIVDVTGSKDKTELLRRVFSKFGHEMKQTIVYVRTLKEVSAVTRMLHNMGYSACGILKQKGNDLNNILDLFSEGEFQFLVNANKLSEGIDLKGCTDVLIARNIGSYTLLNQIIGRAARIDDPRCVVWEFINPMSSNLDTTVVVGKPKSHELLSERAGVWQRQMFNAANVDDEIDEAISA